MPATEQITTNNTSCDTRISFETSTLETSTLETSTVGTN